MIYTPNVLSRGDENPLSPSTTRQQRLGLSLSIPYTFLQGSYRTSCDCPEFTDGNGSGFQAMFLYEPETTSRLLFGIMGGFDFRNITSNYILNEVTNLQVVNSTKIYNGIIIPFRHTTAVTVSTLALMPYIKYFPFANSLFLRSGVEVGTMVSNSLQHKKTLLQKTTLLPDGQEVTVESGLEGPDGYILLPANNPDTKLTSYNALQVGITGAIGAEFMMASRVWLSPVIQYYYPLTSISQDGNSPRIHALQFMVEFHYSFGK